MSLELRPCSIREASAFVEAVHRHHKPPQGARWSVGATLVGSPSVLVGVAIVGNPVARMLDDDYTAEITRLATDGTKNACSFLYAACTRAAKALGYRRLVTYILCSESGESLKALKQMGWHEVGQAGGGTWSRKERPRDDKHPTEPKVRWEVTFGSSVVGGVLPSGALCL